MKKIITTALLTLSGSVFAAGFDCSLASAPIEHRICNNEEISSLDSKLSEIYKVQVKKHPTLKASQRSWLKNVRIPSASDALLIAAYKQRITEISNLDTSAIATASLTATQEAEDAAKRLEAERIAEAARAEEAARIEQEQKELAARRMSEAKMNDFARDMVLWDLCDKYEQFNFSGVPKIRAAMLENAKASIEMYDSKFVSTSYNNYLQKITSHVDSDGNISGLKIKCDEFNAAVKANNMNNEMKKGASDF
ncbi:lysozyme inhibitor LprI family protein [Aeromonas sp. 31P]